jgi:hypothetical protein
VPVFRRAAKSRALFAAMSTASVDRPGSDDGSGRTAKLVTHGGATSSLKGPASLNYLAVRLQAGESWRYQPAIDDTVGWVSPSTGRLRVPQSVEAGELAIFESSNDAIDIHAGRIRTSFSVCGSARARSRARNLLCAYPGGAAGR